MKMNSYNLIKEDSTRKIVLAFESRAGGKKGGIYKKLPESETLTYHPGPIQRSSC